jgi:hypothetical protein
VRLVVGFKMTNARKILIVDDDGELSDALTEQLSQYEEFESVAAENGGKECRLPRRVRLIWS